MKSLDAHVTNLARFPIKQRNILIDSMFYDTGSLDADDQAKLNPLVDREGSIIVVSPRAQGQPIRHYKSALRFMNKEGDRIQGLAIAGVGSSVLGTAALARNVADHYGFDVAGLVTGYGMADVITEAMGGWFFYGYADRFRHTVEWAAENVSVSPRRLGVTLSQEVLALAARKGGAPAGTPAEARSVPSLDFGFIPPSSADSATLKDLLLAAPASLKLVVGHSKGCLLTSFALWHLVDEMEDDAHPFYDTLTVVTLGAVVAIPRQFKRRHQFLGELDWFGGMNSVLDLPHTRVPNAWHHLNTATPLCMSVRDVLRHVPALMTPDSTGAGVRALEAMPIPAAHVPATPRSATAGRPGRTWGKRQWDTADIL